MSAPIYPVLDWWQRDIPWHLDIHKDAQRDLDIAFLACCEGNGMTREEIKAALVANNYVNEQQANAMYYTLLNRMFIPRSYSPSLRQWQQRCISFQADRDGRYDKNSAQNIQLTVIGEEYLAQLLKETA